MNGSEDGTLSIIHSQMKLQFCFSCVLLATFFAVDQVAHIFRFASHRLFDIVYLAVVVLVTEVEIVLVCMCHIWHQRGKARIQGM